MMRLLRLGLTAAAVGAVVAASIWGPSTLRRIDWFHVRNVEVSGTRLLAPQEVLAAAGVARGQSLWEDREVWERPLREHGAIAGVDVSRRIPGTLRIRVEEKQPVAYVEAGALRLATAAGELLPVDPARRPMDLPIVRADWGDSAQSVVARRLLDLVGRLEAMDPALLSEVSEIRATRSGAAGAVLTHRVGELVIPHDTDATRLAELRSVISHLESRAAASGRAAAATRLDLRYDDQVIVRFPSSV